MFAGVDRFFAAGFVVLGVSQDELAETLEGLWRVAYG